MKIHSLTEFAHNLYNTGTPRDMEFAKEILILIDFEQNSRHDEICEDLEKYAKGQGDPLRQVEWLGDRSNMLAEIEEALTEAKILPDGTDDAADAVKKIIELLDLWPKAMHAAMDGAPSPLKYDL